MLVLLLALAHATPTIAVTDLENQTTDSAWDAAGPGLAGLLTTRLAQGRVVQVVERERLAALLDELKLNASDLVDPEQAVRTGRLLGADYIAVGQIFSLKAPTVSVAVRIVETETGSVLIAEEVISDSGDSGDQIFVIADRLADRLQTSLRIELAERGGGPGPTRELDAARDVAVVAADHPDALWRDKTHDLMAPPMDRSWTVSSNAGAHFTASSLAMTLGDEMTHARIQASRNKAQRHNRRNLVIWGAVLAGGVGMAVGGNQSDNKALGTVGALTAVTAGIALPSTVLTGLLRQGLMERPGKWWSPAEADRWIDAHNRDLAR